MENISKIVLSQASGEKIGYILDVVIDFQTFQITGYYVVEEETENELFLKSSDIVAVSEFVVVIDDEANLEFSPVRTKTLIGRCVFDDKGVFFGHVIGLEFHKNKLGKILTDRCEILTKQVSNVSGDIVFVQFKKKHKKVSKRTFPKASSDNVVTIQSLQKPEKVTLATSYYVGKVVGEDIIGYNSERIISKGQVISRSVVDKAKKHNRLNQLFFAIKR